MKTALSPAHRSPFIPQHSQMQQQLKTSDSSMANISFVTKEGDTISIHSDTLNKSIATLAASDTTQTLQTQGVTRDQFSLSVNGDLNDEELADLAQLLDKLGAIADDFYSGDMNGAVIGAMDIGDMGSIAKLEANFSHTTAIQGYLQGASHPVPDMQDMLFDELLANTEQNPNPEQGITDMLQAQWKQFLDYFNSRNENDSTIADSNEQEPEQIDKRQTAAQMFDAAKQTMTKHPRLTPLIPSVADLAIDKNFNTFRLPPTDNAEAKTIKDYFSKEYSNWLI